MPRADYEVIRGNKKAENDDVIEITTTDQAFAADVEAWCRRTGNTFLGIASEKGITKASVKKDV